MRKSLIGFGVVAGTAATIAVVPYFIDWNWFKPQLISAVEDATGYSVDVSGDVGFSFLPGPRLSVEGLRVTGFGPSTQPLITSDKLSAAVAFLPLLSKRVEVYYIALETPVVRLLTYADGTNNWSDPNAEKAEQSDSELSIADFRVENGTLIRFAANSDEMRIDDINAQIEVASSEGPYAMSGSLRYGALPVAFKAGYKMGGGIDLDATLDGATQVQFAGRLGKAAEGAANPVSGRFKVEGETLAGLMDAFADKKKTARGSAYAKPFKLSGTVQGTSERLLLRDVDGNIGGSTVGGTLDVAMGDVMSVEGRAIVGKVNLADWIAEDSKDDSEPFELPEAIKADVLLGVEALSYDDMQFGAVNAPLSLADRRLTIGKTRVTLPGNGEMFLTGLLDAAAGKPRFSGEILANLPRPAASLVALGNKSYAQLPPAAIRGRIGLDDDVVMLSDVKGTFDGQAVTASVRYPLQENSPIDVALAMTTLNMDRLVSRTGATDDSAAARPLRFNVRLGKLLQSGSTYGGISARGSYADDRLTLTDAVIKEALGFGVAASGTVDNMSGKRTADLAVKLAGDDVTGAITVKGPMSKLDIGGAITYAGAKIGLDGWVRTDPDTAYELAATARAPEASAVLAKLRDGPRGASLGPLDLGMQIVGKGDMVRVSGIMGKIGKMDLKGDATVNTAGIVPVVAASFVADVVPLSALLGDDEAGAEAAVSGGERWSNEPLSFDWINSFDGRITMKAVRATYGDYVLDKPQLALVSRGNVATIEGLSAGMFGGALAANGTLSAGNTQSLKISLALNDVPIEPLMQAASASAPATGTLDFSGTFTATGGSQKALMNSLFGPVRIAARNGVIRKIDLKRLDEHLGDLRSANSFIQFAGVALKGGETQYRTLAADLTGKDGRFTIQKVTTDMDGGSATAKGYVDIGKYNANIDATLTLGSHADAPVIPAKIAGNLPTPTVTYSLKPIQGWFAKRFALAGIKAATGGEGLDIGGLLGVKKPATPGIAEDGTAQQPAATEAAEPAPKKSVEEELGGALRQLFKKKTSPPE